MRLNLYNIFTGVAVAIMGGFLVPQISEAIKTEDPDTPDSEVLQKSLFCMTMLGVGECLGGLAIGKFVDKTSSRAGLVYFLVETWIACGITLYAHWLERYGWHWFVVCFMWGIIDSSGATLASIILGFEFVEKTEPFSVYRFLRAFTTFGILLIESELKNATAGRGYLAVVCAIGTISILRALSFDFKKNGDKKIIKVVPMDTKRTT